MILKYKGYWFQKDKVGEWSCPHREKMVDVSVGGNHLNCGVLECGVGCWWFKCLGSCYHVRNKELNNHVDKLEKLEAIEKL